ncbi:MAG: flavin reductase [Devosia sp.]
MTEGVSKTEFRSAMARVCAPVNIITTDGPQGRGGFTATAMCSVTDDPPTVLICMNTGSAQAQLFVENRKFCVNVLTHEQRDLAGHFAGRIPDMAERYAAAKWTTLPSGLPSLDDAIVSMGCELVDLHRVGTHNVLIGHVKELRIRGDGNALLYFDRSYVHVPSQLGSYGG